MSRERIRQRRPHFAIAEGIEMPVIEGKGSLIRRSGAASTEVEQGSFVGRRPTRSLGESRPRCSRRVPVAEVRIERKKSDRDIATPRRSDGPHAVEDSHTLVGRDALHPRFAAGFMRQNLSLVGERKQPAPKHFVEGHMPNENAAHRCGHTRGTVNAFDVGNQASVEVVHRYEHNRKVGFVGRHGLLKEPPCHTGGVPRLPKVKHFNRIDAAVRERGLCGLSDAFRVFDAPSEHGRVAHDDDASSTGGGCRGCLGSKPVCVCRYGEVVGLPHAGHAVIPQVGRHPPLAHRIGLVGWRDSEQSRPHFGQAEECSGEDHPQDKTDTAAGWGSSHALHCIRAAAVAVLLLLSPLSALAVTVTVEVATETNALQSDEDGTLQARVRWFGEEQHAPMILDDDGVWRAAFSGNQARALGVEIWRTDATPPRRISQSLELMPRGDTTIPYAMSKGGDDAAWRLSRSVTTASMKSHQERGAIGTALWAVVGTLLVLLLGRKALVRPRPASRPVDLPPSYELAGWIGFAVLWTWPAVLFDGGVIGRHFDALGTVWVIDSAGRLGLDLMDPFTGWPEGVTYAAIDSWVLILFSWMGSSAGPEAVHSILAIVGVATCGFAASRFARALGAETPAHVLAGVLFAGSGLIASALLEGHVYQVVNPWMPLMAMYLVRSAEPAATWERGVLAGLCFAAALFSSGYLGLSAGIVAVGLGSAGMIGASNRRPLAVAAVVGLAACAVFIQLFSSVDIPGASHATMDTLRMGSLSLNSVGPATAEADRAHHSWALALSTLMVALAVLGLRAGVRFGWAMMATALCAMLVAMGPEWALGIAPDEGRIPSIFAPLWSIPEVRFLRFPGRIMWAAILPLSALAAMGLHAVLTRLGWKPAAGILGLVLVEMAVTVRLPARQVVRPSEAPLAYQSASGAVFDLVGEGTSISREVDSWMNALLCQYQTQHGRPIADDCVSVGPGSNPRLALSSWVVNRLYEGDVPSVFSRLRSLDYTALAVHYDWIAESDAVRFRNALRGYDGVSETSRGDGVTVYPIAADTPERPLISGPASGISGPKDGASLVWPLRVDVLMDRDQELARYFLDVGTEDLMELKDKGTVPGAQYEDGLFTLRENLDVTGPQDVRLIAIDEGVNRVLWSGLVVPVAGTEDRLSFRIDAAGDALPVLRAMDIHSPEVRSRRGKIIGLGWSAAVMLMILWWVRVRKDATGALDNDGPLTEVAS